MNISPNPALVGDLIGDLLNEETVSRDARKAGRAPGAQTGFESLNRELGGFLAPGVHTVLAAPGAGKTALCLQIAACCGCPALYVSAEMRRVELLRRLIARETGEFLGRLRGGQLDAARLDSLARTTAERTPRLALFDAQEAACGQGEGGASANAIAGRAAALKRRFESDQVLVVVDSVTEWAPLHLAGDPDGAKSTEFALAEGAVNGLKNIASVLSCPVIAIAHRHRAAQGAGADRLHGAKGTGRYEYVSESVWDLERLKDGSSGDRVRVQLTLVKNRYGSVGTTLDFDFEGRIQKFFPRS